MESEREHPETTTESGDGSSDERRSSYLGFVAHEVRNPLSTALWTAELLARMSASERGGPRGEKLSAMCLRSLSRVRQLVEDHFLCERLDVGGIPVRAEPLSIREVAEGVVERRAPDAPPVDVAVDPSAAASVDRSLLERALDSLLAAAGQNGPVRLASEQDGEALRLSFSGGAPVERELDDPRKGSPSDPRGRALALPVARRVAAAIGGTLAATDDGYVLTLRRAQGYTPPPDAPSHS